MAAESLLIRARAAFGDLARSVRDATDHSGQFRAHTEAATRAAEARVRFERAARAAGAPSRVIDWDREAENLRRIGRNPDEAFRRQRAWYEERVRQAQASAQPPPSGTPPTQPSETPAIPPSGGIGLGSVARSGWGLLRMVGGAMGAGGIYQIASKAISAGLELPTPVDRLMRIAGGAGGYQDAYDSVMRGAGTDSTAIMPAVDFARLQERFVKLAGAVDLATASEETRAGVQMSRALGLEDSVMPEWLAEMRYRGQGSSQELSTLVAETVGRSQIPGRADEILRGLLTYTERMERVLTKNIDMTGYAETVAALNAFAAPNAANPAGLPGLRGAAGMDVLNQIDQSFGQEGDEATEMFWASFFAKNKVKGRYITDIGEQHYLREEGLTKDPEMMAAAFAHLGKFSGYRGEQNKYMRWWAGEKPFGLSMHQMEDMEKFAELNQSERGQFAKWMEQEGYDLSKAPPSAQIDAYRIYQAATSEKNRGSDILSGLEGLPERLLSKEALDRFGKTPQRAMVPLMLERLMAYGPDTTQRDTLEGAQAVVQNNAARAASAAIEKAADGILGTTKSLESLDESAKELERSFRNLDGSINLVDPTRLGDPTGRFRWLSEAEGNAAIQASPVTGGLSHQINLALSKEREPQVVASPTKAWTWERKAKPYLDLVERYAKQYDVPADLLASQIEMESGWDPNAVGKKGEIGLAQFMPDAASEEGISNRADPEQSIRGQAARLARNAKALGSLRAGVAAHQAGLTGTRRHIQSTGDIPNAWYVNPIEGRREFYRDLLEKRKQKTSWNLDWGRPPSEALDPLARGGVFGAPPTPAMGAATVVFVHTNQHGEEFARQTTRMVIGGAPLPQHIALAGMPA